MNVLVQPVCRLLLVAAALGAAAAPCRAERNRLLPFWGQPYPTGFTRREVDSPGPGPLCRAFDPGRRSSRHGRAAERCVPVLHARG